MKSLFKKLFKKPVKKPFKKPTFWQGFWIAALALGLFGAAALTFFWFYMDAYERSRPQTTVDYYLTLATPTYISKNSTAIPDACDLNLQSEKEARAYIAENIGTVTCLRDSKNSKDDALVYAVMDGAKRIGSVTLTLGKTDIFGFTHWQIAQETYDFSHLLGETPSATVPTGYRVFANGKPLGNEYLTAQKLRFPQLESYYESYNAPTMRTYTTGQILGTPELTVRDANDNPVEILPREELERTFCNCTDEELEKIKQVAELYVKSYVRFSSAAGGKGNRYANYKKLSQYMVPNGDLAKRMKSALDGLYWVGDHNAKIQNLTYNQFIHLDHDAYMCDLTYTINQKIRGGRADSTVNLRLVLVETDKGLKVESMLIYS